MQYTIKCFLFAGLSIIASIRTYAQSTGPATPDVAGGSRKLGGITHEFAIGQVMAGNTYNAGEVVITPGVLQPAVPARYTGNQISSGELQIFPDPVESTLFLLPAFKQGGTLQYALYDAAGSLVMNREAVLKTGTERQYLPVSYIAVGQYFLRVSWIAGQSTPRTSGYKIQKLR
jgi:hypothetical protein